MRDVSGEVLGERVSRTVLSLVVDPGDKLTGRIVQQVGGIATVALLESDDLVPGLSRVDAGVWRARYARFLEGDNVGRLIARTNQVLENQEFKTLIPSDPAWPQGLNDLGTEAPLMLWVKGDIELLSGKLTDRVTVTGSRSATAYGLGVTRDLVAHLTSREKVIVSGGSFGIEMAAHQVALAERGRTIVLMPCGLDCFYPRANSHLFEEIEASGLLVSERPLRVPPMRQDLIARGRLMAALSGTTVVVESGIRSGAITVARKADQLGRCVAALPGPITSKMSTGTNRLIQQGTASLVTSPSEVINLLNDKFQKHSSALGSTTTLGSPEAGPLIRVI